MALVRARAPFATEFYGYSRVIQPGDVYVDDDPLVRAHRSMFEEIVPTAGSAVEQATAAPGERRNTRRG